MPRTRHLLAGLLLSVAVAPPAQAYTPGSTFLVSAAPGLPGFLPGEDSGSGSSTGAVSGDGRYVAFDSTSDGLVAGDDDAAQYSVYVHDRVTRTSTLVSRRDGSAGAPNQQECYDPSISANGRRVAFTCEDGLDASDVNALPDVYVRDLDAGTTTLVSRATGLGAVSPNHNAGDPDISPDGNWVAFDTDAPLDAAADTNGASDVYLRRLGGGDTTELLSRRQNAAVGDLGSTDPSVSSDAKFVAFRSTATNLDATGGFTDSDATADVYVRDTTADTTRIVSTKNGDANAEGGSSSNPSISDDGAFVAFQSDATDLVGAGNDTNGVSDIFVRTRTSTAVVRASVPDTGATPTTGGGFGPSIDAMGATVAFVSRAPNLGDGDTDGLADVHVRDLTAGGHTELISRAEGDAGSKATSESFFAGIAGNASIVAFTSFDGGLGASGSDIARVWARSRTTTPRHTQLISSAPGGAALAGQDAYSALSGAGEAISADGRFVVFVSGADGLSAELGPGEAQGVFVRDTLTNAVSLVSRETGATGAAAASAESGVISADGRFVAFRTATKLDPAIDTNALLDVYVRDLLTGTTTLASRTDSGGAANGAAGDPSIDADGSRVAFSSAATNLGDGDSDAEQDIHVRDLQTGHTLLASVAAGGAVSADGSSLDPSISADGTKVAFSSTADNLQPDDVDVTRDIFLRDLGASTTTLISRAGVKGNGQSSSPSLSADGTRVAFDSRASNLDAADSDVGTDVYLRDLSAQSTALLSRTDAGVRGDQSSNSPTIAADGQSVAFVSYAPNLAGADPELTGGAIILRDLAAAHTLRVAVPGQPLAILDKDGIGGYALSGDGGCMAFDAPGRGYVAPGSDFHEVYVNVIKGTCGPNPIAIDAPLIGAPQPPVAPRLTAVSMLRKRFARSRAKTATIAAKRKRTPKGTSFRFTLSEPAAVTITLQRKVKGRRVGKSCRKATAKLRRRKSCTRYEARGKLTRKQLAAGKNSVAFSGRLGSKALPLGRYRATITAVDADKLSSTAEPLTFTIVAR